MIILAVIYQLITRVTINADLGITEQGVYGIAFLIFSSASVPFASLLNLFLSYASKNQIINDIKKSEYFFSFFYKIIAPLSILCFSCIVVLYNPIIYNLIFGSVR